ncbi:MAG: efflux RND transporter periplasmic adaptor subunit [Candidatus Omnitrophica bacterium]|nr:efflux RND transporter periplasmic adaptor subunit [Candidatus Omnitrophota bacterium]
MRNFGIVTLGALFILAAAGCGKPAEGQSGPGGMWAVGVVSSPAGLEIVEDKLSLVGSLEANETIEVQSELEGTVEAIDFSEGQSVQKGAILIRINEKKLQASLDQAQANLKLAQATEKRYKALVSSNAVSHQEYDQTIATLAAAEATVELAKELLEDATIAAPFSGVLGSRMVSEGQFVSKGTKLTSLSSQDPIKAEFEVPERYLSQVKIGQPVKISVAAYPNEVFEGEVYFIAPQVSQTTRTALVKARIPNPHSKLMRGMFANLDLVLEVRKDAVVVPETAVVLRGDDSFVYVVDEKSAAQIRPVRLGLRLEGRVEVLEGVQAGEVVVAEGWQKIGPGSPVKLAEEQR